ncbi:MAG: glycosyltransferase [Saprospiraceae bacterium]|nr:glycosyltransferase [Saprospiraceae bacterium]
MTKTILYVHLNNDYTGSSRVLTGVIQTNEKYYTKSFILTSNPEKGCLSDLNANYYNIPYKSYRNRYLRSAYIIYLQFILFVKIIYLFKRHKEMTIYVNTLLPFGAALAGKFLSRTVIYHIHETHVRPKFLERIMLFIANNCASKMIYVSEYSKNKLLVSRPIIEVQYNKLSNTFLEQSSSYLDYKQHKYTVLMLSSLNKYKGIDYFVELAKKCPDFEFELVLSAHQKSINNYFSETALPSNLKVFDAQSNVHPFYQRAKLVLNLSIYPYWIESFGMTILEALHYKIPCIVPPHGGPKELIADGYNGYLIPYNELEKMKIKIYDLMNNEQIYSVLSNNAEKQSKLFIH